MASIGGIYNYGSGQIVNVFEIQAMIGKSQAKLSFDKNIAVFGAVDLRQESSDHGNTILSNEDGSLLLVFDGFISNQNELRSSLIKKGHCFNSGEDSGEIILHLFEERKEDTFRMLNGMFAFVIWDKKAREMILVRDRYGIKPLYYYDKGESLIFASHIKPILSRKEVEKKLNQQAFFDYLSLNYIPFNQTIFEGIEKVPVRSYMKFSNQCKIVRYYWYFQTETKLPTNEGQIQEELGYRLKEAVAGLLSPQYTPGVFLSGGLDSGAIAYFLRELRHDQIETFGVSFKEKAYDETKYAKEIAKRLSLNHRVIQLNSRFVEEYEKIIASYENLHAETSIIPFYYLAENAAQYKNCMLCGESGDELLGGYPELLADKLLFHHKRIPSLLKNPLLRCIIDKLPVSDAPVGFNYKAKHFMRGAQMDPLRAHYYWRTVFTDEEKSRLLDRDFYDSAKYPSAFEKYSRCVRDYSPQDLLRGFQIGYLNMLIPDNNLPYYESLASLFSIEMRYPFLDNRLVDFMLKIPMSLKLKNWTTKYILRRLLRKKLPKAVVSRQKHGLSSPIKIWIKKEMKDIFMSRLNEASLKQYPYLNQAYVKQLFKEHLERKADNSRKIWCLFCFVVWHSKYFGEG
jgi:asparagine synthase (glutamine-hydrolysing)